MFGKIDAKPALKEKSVNRREIIMGGVRPIVLILRVRVGGGDGTHNPQQPAQMFVWR